MSKVSEFVDEMVNKNITFEIKNDFVLMSPPSKMTPVDLLKLSKIKNDKLIEELKLRGIV